MQIAGKLSVINVGFGSISPIDQVKLAAENLPLKTIVASMAVTDASGLFPLTRDANRLTLRHNRIDIGKRDLLGG